MKTNSKKLKIVWVVSPQEKGRYSSFYYRSWPMAHLGSRNGDPIAQLVCSVSYSLHTARSGDHPSIAVWVADHRIPEDPGAGRWCWRVLRNKAKTLGDAKHMVAEFYSKPENEKYLPGE